MVLSIKFFTDMLYYRLSLYFPPTQNVSAADSPWWQLNQDDKQLKNQILIGCSDDKTLAKHALFYVFSNNSLPHRESFPELKPPLNQRNWI